MTQMQHAGSGIKQDFEIVQSASAPQSAYAPIVQQLKDHSSNYAQEGSVAATTVALRKEAKLEGLNDPNFIWDCTLQCYDRKLIEQGGADVEGQYVSTLFLPFEEAKYNKTLAQLPEVHRQGQGRRLRDPGVRVRARREPGRSTRS